MKAYYVGIESDPDVGQEIVFADTAQEARKKAQCLDITDYAENWIDIYARRAKEFDGMENASEDDIALKQWREGWIWFDRTGQPDEATATDEEFFEWLISE